MNNLSGIGKNGPEMLLRVLGLIEEFIQNEFDVCLLAAGRGNEWIISEDHTLWETMEGLGQWEITYSISQGDDNITMSASDIYAGATAHITPSYSRWICSGHRELDYYELVIRGETTSNHRYSIYTRLSPSGQQISPWRLDERNCDFGGQSFWAQWLLDGEFVHLPAAAWTAVRSLLTRQWLDGELNDEEYLARTRCAGGWK
jgi:hypothetical protein